MTGDFTRRKFVFIPSLTFWSEITSFEYCLFRTPSCAPLFYSTFSSLLCQTQRVSRAQLTTSSWSWIVSVWPVWSRIGFRSARCITVEWGNSSSTQRSMDEFVSFQPKIVSRNSSCFILRTENTSCTFYVCKYLYTTNDFYEICWVKVCYLLFWSSIN